MTHKPANHAPEASATVAMAQLEVSPGEPARNGARMLELIAEARGRGVSLLAFPEMSLPGYLLGDMWERRSFLRECETWTERIIEATGHPGPPVTVVFGTVIADWRALGEDGRVRKYNGYVAARGGAALRHPGLDRPFGIKTLLPNYREFEEPRHFHDARKLALETGRSLDSLLEPFVLELGGRERRVGILLCEDAWEDDYAQKPLEILGGKHCDFFLNLSCSPFTQGKNEKRNRVFARKVAKLGVPLLYVNCVSLQNNGKTLFTFDGRSTAYAADGSVRAEMAAYAQALLPLEMEWRGGKADLAAGTGSSPAPPEPPAKRRMGEIHQALKYGAQSFLSACGQDRVVIGVSGGIDSAVTAALYREILPPQNLLLVNMPSRFNSNTTRNLARELASNLGCLYAEIGIEDSLAVTKAQLDGLEITSPDGSRFAAISLAGFVMENVQARDRSSRILAALAASFAGVFTCNANKAELTVGYSTLYGDLGGYLALLGDLWKNEVYALGRHLNEDVFGREVIPEGSFAIVPSAELSESQAVDEGKGDPLIYPYHDRLFFAWVQRWNRAAPEEILEWYAAGTLNAELGLEEVDVYDLFPAAPAFIRDLERWWNLYNGIAVAKRVQAPPILAVSSRAFGFDHREALGRPAYSLRYLKLRGELLAGAGTS
ncbi:MAG TPA: NAD(+) synthase [Fibrobacteria bacterium]|nr:NAD(+) synthase [Fibrobacteria bacterium]